MTASVKVRRCKECPEDSTRPAPYPGPRCYTHHQAARKATKQRRHEKYVTSTYSLSEGDYQRLYAGQNGRCWICGRATGATKRLAVDHDHRCCPGAISCGRCVAGLLCGPCNRDVIGHLRRDPHALARAYWYLVDPPAPRILGYTWSLSEHDPDDGPDPNTDTP